MTSRWTNTVLGAAAFLSAHAVEAWRWRDWFAQNAYAAWFLNSGPAVAFTVLCLFVVSGFMGAFGSADRRESVIRGAYFSGGAVAAMSGVLFVTGPGTIWPIVLVVGAGIVALASLSGTLAGWAIRRAS
jgi:hypothetical protein